MKLYVKEKLFSLHRKFNIKDENDKDVYEISSKIISIGSKTTVSDIDGNKIVYIEREIFHITPHYRVYVDGNLELMIAKKFQIFRNDYVLSNNYKVEGDFLSLDFRVYDELHNQIGSINRKFLTIGDKYEIEITDDSKKNIVLAIIVAIANDIDNSQANNG